MKVYYIIGILLLLFGCANGIPNIDTSIAPSGVSSTVEKTFVGVPPLISMEGSKVRLDHEWVLTVKHNYPILNTLGEDVHYHPSCDVALIRDVDYNAKTNVVGYLMPSDTAYLIGYPIGFPLSVNTGKYVADFTIGQDTCNYSGVDATVMGGMSGGGVFNQKGELVGVVVGFSDVVLQGKRHRSIGTVAALANPTIKNWIAQVTGKEYL